MEIGNQIGIAVGTGLAGSLIATTGPTTSGLGGVFVIAAAGGLIALYTSTRFGITVQH